MKIASIIVILIMMVAVMVNSYRGYNKTQPLNNELLQEVKDLKLQLKIKENTIQVLNLHIEHLKNNNDGNPKE